jgi:hypothetical protein
VWLIVGAALLVRLYDLGKESAWTDELWAVQRAESGIWSAIESQASRCDPNWAYDCVLHYWICAFGRSEYSTRLPSVIFGTLAVYGIYAVGELLFNRRTGITAAAILGLSVLHVDFSQQARMYTLSSFLMVASYYSFVRILRGGSVHHYFCWFAVTALSFYTHVLCAIAVAGQPVFLVLRRKQVDARTFVDLLILHVALLVAINPCLYLMFGAPEPLELARTYFGVWANPTWRDVLDVLVDFAGSSSLLALFMVPTGLAAAHMGLLRRGDARSNQPESSAIAAQRSNTLDARDGLLLALLWLLVPLLMFLPAFVVPSLHSVWRTRYLFCVSLPFTLLVAHGYQAMGNRWLRRAGAALFVVLAVAALVRHDHDLNRQQLRQACAFMDRHAESDDLIVVYPAHYANLVGPYYLEGRRWSVRPLAELPRTQTPTHNQPFQRALQRVLGERKRTWILCCLDHDESRAGDLTLALALVRETVAGQWTILYDRAYESRTRVLSRPYVGAHVILLEHTRTADENSRRHSSQRPPTDQRPSSFCRRRMASRLHLKRYAVTWARHCEPDAINPNAALCASERSHSNVMIIRRRGVNYGATESRFLADSRFISL